MSTRSLLPPSALVALVALASLVAAPATRAAAPGSGLPALLEEQARAWNRGDLDAFCAAYADDALFLSPSGLTKGRQAVLDRYRAKYPDAAARGTLSFEVLDVRKLGDAGASVAARWKIAREGKAPAEGLTLLSLERRGASWRIVHDASM